MMAPMSFAATTKTHACATLAARWWRSSWSTHLAD
ncbi:MAG: hypothetical protein RI907_2918 [Pseudomonadota bacterium]|jgi:hypothetical protein